MDTEQQPQPEEAESSNTQQESHPNNEEVTDSAKEAESTEENSKSKESEDKDAAQKDDGDWATNLFYAYARRTDDTKSARYILTFSSARVCNDWWSLFRSEFGGTRESAQLFTLRGDDVLVKARKISKFDDLKTKWFFTQLGDANGTGGRGQEIIPLQDERGWVIGTSFKKEERSSPTREPSPPSPPVLNTDESGENKWKERRRSKRDSGIMLMSPHLFERRDSAALEQDQQKPKFDFERMERNLDKVEKLMEQNAKQMRSLEHVQAANMERLTSALVQNAEMVRELAAGQRKLGDMVQELSKAAAAQRDESMERPVSVLTGSTRISTTDGCKHVVKTRPRKLGRTVVGYVYADDGKDGRG